MHYKGKKLTFDKSKSELLVHQNKELRINVKAMFNEAE
jgi:hypothetical protein